MALISFVLFGTGATSVQVEAKPQIGRKYLALQWKPISVGVERCNHSSLVGQFYPSGHSFICVVSYT